MNRVAKINQAIQSFFGEEDGSLGNLGTLPNPGATSGKRKNKKDKDQEESRKNPKKEKKRTDGEY